MQLTNTIVSNGNYDFKHNTALVLAGFSGNFGGGSITIQSSFDGITYIDVPNGIITSATIFIMGMAPYGRLVVAGAVNPNIDVNIKNFT